MKFRKSTIRLRLLLPFIIICHIATSLCQAQPVGIVKVDNYNDSVAKHYFTTTTPIDPVEGIWQSDNGYKLAIEKVPEKNGSRNSKRFRAIILASDYPSDLWKPGYIKAYIERTATTDVFYIDYYTGNHDTLKTESCSGSFVGEQKLNINFINKTNVNSEITLYKIYPEQEDFQYTEKDFHAPGYGSGLVFTKDGYIVTCLHVISDAQTISITGINKDFSKKYGAKVINTDELNDLALLKITDTTFNAFSEVPFTFRFGDMKQDEEVYALGYPEAIEMPESTTLSDGSITSTSGLNGDKAFFRTSVRLLPGNSGGPLFDSNGNIAGINNLYFSKTENVGFAINAKSLRELINITDNKPTLPNKNTIADKPLLEKVNILSNYVCVVECNNYFNLTSFKSTNIKIIGNTDGTGVSDNPETYYTLALFNINNKDFSSALDNLTKAIKGGVKNFTLYYLRGQIRLILQKDVIDAVDDFNYCLKNDTSGNVTYLYYRGEAYRSLKKYKEAVKDFSICIDSASEKYFDALVSRALVYAEIDEYAKAITDWDTVLANMNNTESASKATVYYYKSYCLFKNAQNTDALALINKALDIIATNTDMWVLRAKIYYNMSQYNNSINDINKALTITEDSEAYYVRCLDYKELGMKEQACKDLEKAKSMGWENILPDVSNYCRKEE